MAKRSVCHKYYNRKWMNWWVQRKKKIQNGKKSICIFEKYAWYSVHKHAVFRFINFTIKNGIHTCSTLHMIIIMRKISIIELWAELVELRSWWKREHVPNPNTYLLLGLLWWDISHFLHKHYSDTGFNLPKAWQAF